MTEQGEDFYFSDGDDEFIRISINVSGSDTEDSSDYEVSSQEEPDYKIRRLGLEELNHQHPQFDIIREFLQNLFYTNYIDSLSISSILIGDWTAAGTLLIKVNNNSEDHIHGILSVFNLYNFHVAPCVQNFLQFIHRMANIYADVAVQTELASILNTSNKIGLIINERLKDVPATITEQLFFKLRDHVNNPISNSFEYFIIICKAYQEKSKLPSKELMYENPEEVLFVCESTMKFQYYIIDSNNLNKDRVPSRIVCVFSRTKFNHIVDLICGNSCES